jgi:shikimate kinase
MASRGVVIEPGQTLETLFKKRSGLYERYADLIIPLAEQSHEQAVQAILQRLQEKDGKEPIG